MTSSHRTLKTDNTFTKQISVKIAKNAPVITVDVIYC